MAGTAIQPVLLRHHLRRNKCSVFAALSNIIPPQNGLLAAPVRHEGRKMIDHTGFSVSDFAASKQFYTRVLASLGHVIRREFAGEAAGFGPEQSENGADPGGAFWITAGTPSTPRVHLAFSAKNKEQVEAFYKAALDAGGKDNGAPGYRPQYHPGYYAAFILDPDGYNIEAVWHEPGGQH